MIRAQKDNANQAIQESLQNYFDGLYFGDLNRLQQVFHPQAHYVCACGPAFEQLTMPQYFQRVEQRPTPASRHEHRHDRIVSIDIAGPETALAKVNCAIGNRYFTDFLSFIFIEGRWQIIAKVFHYHEEN